MYKLYRRVPITEPAQFVGVSTLHWGKVEHPKVAFVEVESWDPEGIVFLTALKLSKSPIYKWDELTQTWRCCYCGAAVPQGELFHLSEERTHVESCSWLALREAFTALDNPTTRQEEEG